MIKLLCFVVVNIIFLQTPSLSLSSGAPRYDLSSSSSDYDDADSVEEDQTPLYSYIETAASGGGSGYIRGHDLRRGIQGGLDGRMAPRLNAGGVGLAHASPSSLKLSPEEQDELIDILIENASQQPVSAVQTGEYPAASYYDDRQDRLAPHPPMSFHEIADEEITGTLDESEEDALDAIIAKLEEAGNAPVALSEAEIALLLKAGITQERIKVFTGQAATEAAAAQAAAAQAAAAGGATLHEAGLAGLGGVPPVQDPASPLVAAPQQQAGAGFFGRMTAGLANAGLGMLGVQPRGVGLAAGGAGGYGAAGGAYGGRGGTAYGGRNFASAGGYGPGGYGPRRKGSGGLSGGAIAGIVIACLVVLGGAFYFYNKSKQQQYPGGGYGMNAGGRAPPSGKYASPGSPPRYEPIEPGMHV